MRFVDTNVLLYAISRAPAEREKAALANEILERREVALSSQVLQEFYVEATRPTRSDALTHFEARELLETFVLFPVQAITSELVVLATATRERFGISYWDAAILEASRALGCDVVLSEDLDDRTDYDGVRVVNPFGER